MGGGGGLEGPEVAFEEEGGALDQVVGGWGGGNGGGGGGGGEGCAGGGGGGEARRRAEGGEHPAEFFVPAVEAEAVPLEEFAEVGGVAAAESDGDLAEEVVTVYGRIAVDERVKGAEHLTADCVGGGGCLSGDAMYDVVVAYGAEGGGGCHTVYA